MSRRRGVRVGQTTLGIDFGTSTTLIAHRSASGLARIVPLGRTTSWFPSLAAIEPRSRGLLVGEDALEQPSGSLIRSVKTALGRGETTLTRSLADGGTIEVAVDDVVQRILAAALDRAHEADPDASNIQHVHLGCPAIWQGPERQRLTEIAAKVGIHVDVSDVLDEPIAAGISWVLNSQAARGERPTGFVLVFDYGGGTLDVAVLEIADGMPPEITVLAAGGVDEAGDVLDLHIADQLVADLRGENVPFNLDAELTKRVLELAAARLKIQLTSASDASTTLPAPFSGVELHLSRQDLEAIIAPQLDRAMRLVDAVLRSAQLRKRGVDVLQARSLSTGAMRSEIRHVLLSGGLSRVPAVRDRLVQTFPNAIVAHDPLIDHPEESVVSGLTFEEVVSRLNLHRPGFSFVLSSGMRREMLYRAYAPLYEPWQVMTGYSDLGTRTEIHGLGESAVHVCCESPSGERLLLQIDGSITDSLKLSPDRGTVVFKLYVDGRVVVNGEQLHTFRVERWPVLRGGASGSPIVLQPETRDDDANYRAGHWWSGE